MRRLVLLFASVAFAVSCNKSADCYSCNVEVDSFVKENAIELRDMPVTELVAYNPEVQRAAFRMYDEQKRQKVWEEKYAYILDNNPNGYSAEELAAVRELSDYVTEKGIDKTENVFINRWIEQTREDFLWRDNRYRFLIMSLDVDEGHYRKSYGIGESSVMNLGNCECNVMNDGILIKDCPYTEGECSQSDKCEKKSLGCGKFFVERCNGECSAGGGGWPEKNQKN